MSLVGLSPIAKLSPSNWLLFSSLAAKLVCSQWRLFSAGRVCCRRCCWGQVDGVLLWAKWASELELGGEFSVCAGRAVSWEPNQLAPRARPIRARPLESKEWCQLGRRRSRRRQTKPAAGRLGRRSALLCPAQLSSAPHSLDRADWTTGNSAEWMGTKAALPTYQLILMGNRSSSGGGSTSSSTSNNNNNNNTRRKTLQVQLSLSTSRALLSLELLSWRPIWVCLVLRWPRGRRSLHPRPVSTSAASAAVWDWNTRPWPGAYR